MPTSSKSADNSPTTHPPSDILYLAMYGEEFIRASVVRRLLDEEDLDKMLEEYRIEEYECYHPR